MSGQTSSLPRGGNFLPLTGLHRLSPLSASWELMLEHALWALPSVLRPKLYNGPPTVKQARRVTSPTPRRGESYLYGDGGEEGLGSTKAHHSCGDIHVSDAFNSRRALHDAHEREGRLIMKTACITQKKAQTTPPNKRATSE